MTTEPTPSQLKIDGMPETEVLRIDGNVTITKGDKDYFVRAFHSFIDDQLFEWNGTISPLNPAAESFMVEVPKDELARYKNHIAELSKMVADLKETAILNDKAYSDLAEQLRQEKEQLKVHKEVNEIRKKTIAIQRNSIEKAEQIIKALELRLRVKDSPIKAGLKRICKWFKGLVGK